MLLREAHGFNGEATSWEHVEGEIINYARTHSADNYNNSLLLNFHNYCGQLLFIVDAQFSWA